MSKKILRDHYIYQYQDYDLNIPARIINVSSVETGGDSAENGVDFALANRTIKNLLTLDSINNDPITIIINNPGGDFYHGMAIYDAIRACKSRVIIKGIGQIMSMGAVIMQAGDERLMYKNAKMMIHYGESGYYGHSKTMEKWSEEFKKNDRQIESIFYKKIKNKNPKFNLLKLKEMLNHDTILSSSEALRLGLIDGIIAEKDDQTQGE